MAEIVTKGYLVARSDYDVFDEILTFINEHGNRFVMFAYGTRRISSKNARSLFFGNYLEFEFFHARAENKMSKLKKVVSLDQIDYKYENTYSLIILSQLVSSVVEFNYDYYLFYQMILGYVLLEIDDYYTACFLIIKFMLMNGIVFNLNSCGVCNSRMQLQTLDLNQQHLVCHDCFELNPDLIQYNIKCLKLWHKLAKLSNITNKDEVDSNTAKALLKILGHVLYDKLGIYLLCLKHIN
ncbi:DNA recombination protein RecO [Ureaplasma diversum]|uniref:DNA repair protein RecO n=2 Tax=Ureaplasma diversum TaxID=42094 RepID=A0A084F1G9_9BACT|nr:DNA repair protein RecO [Ureaplasma diversum]AJQ45466.1 DNA recombination protein RecO [Ureaplasma diversum]KEZ24061.1 DNA repair protein RecO [Ureaplasma diversum NCTC 246]